MSYNCLPLDGWDGWWIQLDSHPGLDGSFKPGKDFMLMQFTGLTDENGKEIYEGDIVDIPRGIVTFNTDNFAGLPAFHLCDAKGRSLNYHYGVAANPDCLVIGNIHENPELLLGDGREM